MDDEDDEPITIDHLVGTKCILNESVQVDLRRNRRINNRIEIVTDDGRSFLLVGSVSDMTADGGFVVTLTNRKGLVVSDKARLIAENLYKPKPTQRRHN